MSCRQTSHQLSPDFFCSQDFPHSSFSIEASQEGLLESEEILHAGERWHRANANDAPRSSVQVSRSIEKDDTTDSPNGLKKVAQLENQAVHQNSEDQTMAKDMLNALDNRNGAGETKSASSPQQKRGSQEESGCITSGAEERQGSHLCVSIKHEEDGSNGGMGDERSGQAGRNNGCVEAESAVTKKKERKSTDAGNVGSVDAAGASGRAGTLKRRSSELSQLFDGGIPIEDAARKRRPVNHADGGMSSLAMPMQPTAPTTLFSSAKNSNPSAQKESRGSAGGKRDSIEEDRKKEKEKSGKKSKKKSEPEIFAIDRILDKRREKGK
jgi:hypothetical protein